MRGLCRWRIQVNRRVGLCCEKHCGIGALREGENFCAACVMDVGNAVGHLRCNQIAARDVSVVYAGKYEGWLALVLKL